MGSLNHDTIYPGRFFFFVFKSNNLKPKFLNKNFTLKDHVAQDCM